MVAQVYLKLRRVASLALVLLISGIPASAGILVQGTQGLTMTGSDGVFYQNASGLTMTGSDGFLGLGVNGIFGMTPDGLTMTGSDGLTMTGSDGLTMTGSDGVSYVAPNSYTATRVDGLTMTGSDGLTMTGSDGLTMTGSDGAVYVADSVVVRQPNGLTMTGSDNVRMFGVDGLTMTGSDGLTMTGSDGLTMTGSDGLTMTGSDSIVATTANGVIYTIPSGFYTVTGLDRVTLTGADGIVMTGVEGLTMTGSDGLTMTGSDAAKTGESNGLTMTGSDGLRSFDPELALRLDGLTDDSNVNAVVVYHRAVSDADVADLQRLGILGGTRYVALPMVATTATKRQLFAVSKLPAVRSIYGNRTLQWSNNGAASRVGLPRARVDVELAQRFGGMQVSGAGVGVAVLDTGIDATHSDLSGRVVKNVKLADAQGLNVVGFAPPSNVEGLASTDNASGHGTFVAGVIGGNGTRSGGRLQGYAPKARLVGLGAGDATLLSVLAGFDYLLQRADLDVRVVNCSFSANTIFDVNDPVNVATRMLYDRGVNVVFSAGNTGPGLNSLNPYAAAPWVISVGATDRDGRLASFSSRGDFGSRTFKPTLVAPGVNVVSLRASGVNATGTTGPVTGTDSQDLSATELPYYTTSSGTSFSAPQVAGTIALMLQANPSLTPTEVRDILQSTATPLPPYYQHEVGAGMLNAYAAVLQAAFPQRRIGLLRSSLDREAVRFVKEPVREFSGTVMPGAAAEISLTVPSDAVYASTQVAWGPMLSTNDLALAFHDPADVRRAASNQVNLPGLTGKRERTLVARPAAGTWKARVTNTLGFAGTPQEFKGTFEVARVEYAPMLDLGGLDADTADKVRLAVRTFTMWPQGSYFRPLHPVTRADFAAALVNAGRVPLYVPGNATYLDVRDATTMNSVESVQAAPGGPLFHDAASGGRFRPNEQVSRLLAAIVLVRAAGLRSLAESGTVKLTATDAASVPTQWHGYVAVAIERGLIKSGAAFNPQGSFTRADLARSLAALMNAN